MSIEGTRNLVEKTPEELFKERFPKAIQLSFTKDQNKGGYYKGASVKIERPGYLFGEKDLVLIATKEEADAVRKELEKGLKQDKWEGNYVCADNEIAHYLHDGLSKEIGFQNPDDLWGGTDAKGNHIP